MIDVDVKFNSWFDLLGFLTVILASSKFCWKTKYMKIIKYCFMACAVFIVVFWIHFYYLLLSFSSEISMSYTYIYIHIHKDTIFRHMLQAYRHNMLSHHEGYRVREEGNENDRQRHDKTQWSNEMKISFHGWILMPSIYDIGKRCIDIEMVNF